MFDTHCHLNFHSFENSFEDIISQAKRNGVSTILIPGTDITSSKKAIEIASNHDDLYAAVGIHPHHIKEFRDNSGELVQDLMSDILSKLESLLQSDKVVAVGEVGMDRHIYEQTKYEVNSIDEEYIHLQKLFLIEQIKLAIKYKKSLVLHNREAKEDMLEILERYSKVVDSVPSSFSQSSLKTPVGSPSELVPPTTKNETLLDLSHSVFHCCEADIDLLDFAKAHGMHIGVDGDITWSRKKQRFIKEVPLEMLVLETDSPFLTPEPVRHENPQNNPSNLRIVCQKVADVKEISFETVAQVTEENGRKLFGI